MSRFIGKIDRSAAGGVLISAEHAHWMAQAFRLSALGQPPQFSSLERSELRVWADRFDECLRPPPALMGSDYG